ncbi:MAG: choice-of-anchor D domain-containing protein [Proteobacteria bacterium]|nr:choice-of-anchor D domain-containing protein [Pseudomonadota bacterium]MCP4915377.1 choice-of-anchor D domain-containing protein [Pseudomonadota bacterium]
MMISILAFGLGCSDYKVAPTDSGALPGDDDFAPDISTDPTFYDFGSLQVGERESLTIPIQILNDGDSDLRIMDVHLSDADSAYDLGVVESVLVPPGRSTAFTVTFTPETAVQYEVAVLIDSNDPDEPTYEVPLSGLGIAPIVEVLPSEYDFGTLYIGCEGLLPVSIGNAGNDDLVVDDLVYSTGSTDLAFDADVAENGDFEVEPWEILPGAEVEVWIDYAPLDEYQDVAYLQVFSNDPVQPTAQATQNGNGALAGQNTDVFEQPINGETDILFAVDWSGSMSEDVANVEANFGTFVSTLASMDAEYHVAVVTEDDGCVNYPAGTQPWIDNSMSVVDQEDVFSTMLCEQYSGSSCRSSGANTERAFMLLEAALKTSNVGTGGCNEGFYREDATLSLVGVSDEPEQSVNPYTYYVSLFQGMKDDADDVVMHAIGGDYPGGCGGNDAYTGFYEATVATGGLFLSICATDFGSHLEALAEGSAADLTSFELTDIPVPATIEVTMNGLPVPTGWTYTPGDNTIDFDDDHVPEGGSTIQITYALYGDCEG